MLTVALRFCLLFLLVQFCKGFNIIIPDRLQVAVGDIITFQLSSNWSDIQNNSSRSFVAMLIKPPDDFNCQNLGVGGDNGTVSEIVESFAFAYFPTVKGSSGSGSIILSPRTSGTHFICTYGNASEISTQGNGTSITSVPDLLRSLVLLDQSDEFDVEPISTPEDQSDNTPVAPIVGGIIGGVALLASVFAVLFYRQRRVYQRKLEQLSEEYKLQQQLEPSPFPSTITNNIMVPHLTKGSSNHSQRPPSADEREETSLGTEAGAMQTQVSLHTSVNSTPPSYVDVVVVPNHPGLAGRLDDPEKQRV
ncbi:hypothetical protein L218DRAFT_173750 [Marasmius fiardii PR-910]|nr:hypothetical protein L218DRAFT_173750 [Marasmius fiardii PR-910]